jgi:hypothetical protein
VDYYQPLRRPLEEALIQTTSGTKSTFKPDLTVLLKPPKIKSDNKNNNLKKIDLDPDVDISTVLNKNWLGTSNYNVEVRYQVARPPEKQFATSENNLSVKKLNLPMRISHESQIESDFLIL